MTAPASTVAVIGAGASLLVDELLGDRHRVVAVDISDAALRLLRVAHGDNDLLMLKQGDARSVAIAEPIDAWQDRAMFHFLTDAGDRAEYAANAATSVAVGGHLVLAAFALAGPEQCSGLPVQRHDATSIGHAFEGAFDLVESFEADHTTPWGTLQRFIHAVLRRA